MQMLGFEVSERTVSRLMPRRAPKPAQRWMTFLRKTLTTRASKGLEHPWFMACRFGLHLFSYMRALLAVELHSMQHHWKRSRILRECTFRIVEVYNRPRTEAG